MIWSLLDELLRAILQEIDRLWKGELTQQQLDDIITVLANLKNQYENRIITTARIEIVDAAPYPSGEIWKPILPKFSKLTDDLERKLVDDIKYFKENGIGRDQALQAIRSRFKTTEGYTRVLYNTANLALRNKQKVDFALSVGIRWFLYTGTSPQRKFCKEHYLNVYHIDEIDAMDNGQKLPVRYFVGGYNCMHGLDQISEFDYHKYPKILANI